MNKTIELALATRFRSAFPMRYFGLAIAIALAITPGESSTPVTPVLKQLGAMPLGFEPNRGQAPAGVDFISTGIGANISLRSTSITLTRADQEHRAADLRLAFVGGNPNSKPDAAEPLPGFTQSYWIGRDPSKWILDLPKYAKVRYHEVWPGVDVVFYGNGHQLEYDFVVAPGADPSAIQLKFSGMDSIALDPSGSLQISTGAGDVVQKAPEIYQEIGGIRHKVPGQFKLARDGAVLLALGPYDHSRPLVVDPLLIYYRRLVGGLPAAASGFGIAVTGAGSAYVVGQTVPATSASCTGQTTGVTSAFLFKLDSMGNGGSVVLSGCDGDSAATAVALDSNSNVFIAGWSKASDFIFINNGFQTTFGDTAGSGNSDGFLIKLLGSNGSPAYSTYIGGIGNDIANAIAIDTNGKAYVTGKTCASNFHTTVGPTYRATGCTAFAVKIDTAALTPAASLVYSTLIGGMGADSGNGVAVDGGGNAFVAGSTTSTASLNDFLPFTSTGFFTSKSTANQDGFLVKLNSAGSAATWLTFMTGAPANALSLDANGNAYVTGQTTGVLQTNPTNLGFQTTPQGGVSDAFLQRYNTTINGTGAFVYSTYLGGSALDIGYGVSSDATGNAQVVGTTSSTNFPSTSNALLPNPSTPPDAFVTEIHTNVSGPASGGNSLVLGGDGSDDARSVADVGGVLYLTGTTGSSNFGGQTGQVGSAPYAVALMVPLAPVSEIGVFHQGAWYLDHNGNGQWDGAAIDIRFPLFGLPTDIPVTGDWNGNGTTKIGVYHHGTWYLDTNGNGQWDGPGVDTVYPQFGLPTDIPVTGDWDGSGTTKIGVYHNGTWYLDTNGNGKWDGPAIDTMYPQFGLPTDIPVTGDWDGSGRTKIGVYHDGTWYLDLNGNGQWDGASVDTAYPLFGLAADVPVTGDWNGAGKTKIGVYHQGTWYLDNSGNGQWDGASVDITYPLFGLPADVPVIRQKP